MNNSNSTNSVTGKGKNMLNRNKKKISHKAISLESKKFRNTLQMQKKKKKK